MTSALEQEALAIFAAHLAAFLDEAVAKLDALGAGPREPPRDDAVTVPDVVVEVPPSAE
jgi:hypothetical protein